MNWTNAFLRGLFLLPVAALAVLLTVSPVWALWQGPPVKTTVKPVYAWDLPEDIPKEPEVPEGVTYCDDGFVYCEDIPLSDGRQLAAQMYCQRYGVDYGLFLGLIECESSFRPEADNGISYGYCQINRLNFAWLREAGIDPETPLGNLEAGAYILGDLLTRHDTQHALMAYNCGETGAGELWAKGYDTSEYSRKVVEAGNRWRLRLGLEG